MNSIRKTLIFASVAAAMWLLSYGLDTKNLILWEIGSMWIAIVMLAQLWPTKKKKRHRKSSDTLQGQVERNINFAETQLK